MRYFFVVIFLIESVLIFGQIRINSSYTFDHISNHLSFGISKKICKIEFGVQAKYLINGLSPLKRQNHVFKYNFVALNPKEHWGFHAFVKHKLNKDIKKADIALVYNLLFTKSRLESLPHLNPTKAIGNLAAIEFEYSLTNYLSLFSQIGGGLYLYRDIDNRLFTDGNWELATILSLGSRFEIKQNKTLNQERIK